MLLVPPSPLSNKPKNNVALSSSTAIKVKAGPFASLLPISWSGTSGTCLKPWNSSTLARKTSNSSLPSLNSSHHCTKNCKKKAWLSQEPGPGKITCLKKRSSSRILSLTPEKDSNKNKARQDPRQTQENRKPNPRKSTGNNPWAKFMSTTRWLH
jgi:hypothetical protein